jgi:hypothetical protein
VGEEENCMDRRSKDKLLYYQRPSRNTQITTAASERPRNHLGRLSASSFKCLGIAGIVIEA